jgi:hypothetical protein
MSALRLRVGACAAAIAALTALAGVVTVADVTQDARPVPHVVVNHP